MTPPGLPGTRLSKPTLRSLNCRLQFPHRLFGDSLLRSAQPLADRRRSTAGHLITLHPHECGSAPGSTRWRKTDRTGLEHRLTSLASSINLRRAAGHEVAASARTWPAWPSLAHAHVIPNGSYFQPPRRRTKSPRTRHGLNTRKLPHAENRPGELAADQPNAAGRRHDHRPR